MSALLPVLDAHVQEHIDEHDKEEQHQTDGVKRLLIQASYTGVGHAGDNAGGEKAHRRKHPRHIGHIARHQNDGHRLTDGPAHAQHHRRRDAAAGGVDADPEIGLHLRRA